MIEFGGIIYYIDINAFDKAVTTSNKPNEKIKQVDKKTVTNEEGKIIGTETVEIIRDKGKEIEPTKYDVLRELLMVILDTNDVLDASLGTDRALDGTSLSYKIAFNTLLNYGIIKEQD